MRVRFKHNGGLVLEIEPDELQWLKCLASTSPGPRPPSQFYHFLGNVRKACGEAIQKIEEKNAHLRGKTEPGI